MPPRGAAIISNGARAVYRQGASAPALRAVLRFYSRFLFRPLCFWSMITPRGVSRLRANSPKTYRAEHKIALQCLRHACISRDRVTVAFLRSCRRPLTYPRQLVPPGRAEASAGSSFAIRSCIYILQEVANGERKTKIQTKRRNPFATASGFQPLLRFAMQRTVTERKASTVFIFFPFCFPSCAVCARPFTFSRTS